MPDQEGDLTNRRTLIAAALLPSSAGADTVRAYTRQAASTEVEPSDVEALDLAVHRIGANYSATPPKDLWPIVAAHRNHAFLLLNRRHTLREGRELARHAGMLSVILAWTAHDLGQRELLDALCDDAWEQGHQAGAYEVAAWAEDVRATDALYSGRPLDALTAATRGLAVAPRNGNAVIRLAAQVARAYARLGDTDSYVQAAARANSYRERLPLLASGLFAVDSVRITSYEASSWGWLGNHDKARTAATEAIEHYASAPCQAPTRLAIARLDLAFAHAELGAPDAAIAVARQSLVGNPPVRSVHNRVDQLTRHLMRRYPALPLISEFNEETAVLTS
jgi:tetratricopeptide (TPR) repeat protein